jgi:hypothetical protein
MLVFNQLRRSSFVFACGALLCLPLFAVESDRASIPCEGVLVLANGRVIEGVVAAEGEYFKVVLPKGKLQVRIDQVDFLCQSKEEAYIRRRARRITATATADTHLEMARWCVQNELLAYADTEIAAARKVDPQNRLLPVVEQQLTQARELKQRSTQAAPLIKDSQIAAASLEVEASSRAFDEIPSWARTEFIKRIQPMMAQSCATSGCHLPNTPQKLQIDRLALDGVGNPDLIHRNLASTIALLDLSKPEASHLLEMGASAHGSEGKKSRPLTPHQLEILRAWIIQLALNEPPRENIEATPTAQIVVGMNNGSQQKFVLGANRTSASPDPFDPAEYNKSLDAVSTAQNVETTQPAEVLETEPTQ